MQATRSLRSAAAVTQSVMPAHIIPEARSTYRALLRASSKTFAGMCLLLCRHFWDKSPDLGRIAFSEAHAFLFFEQATNLVKRNSAASSVQPLLHQPFHPR